MAATYAVAVVEALYSTDNHKEGALGAFMPYSVEINFGAYTLELEITEDMTVISGQLPPPPTEVENVQRVLTAIQNAVTILKNNGGSSFEVIKL